MEHMTVKVKKENEKMLLPTFIDRFDIVFNDQEFAFKGNKKFITLVLASLRLEDVHSFEESICPKGVVLTKIYFIHEGKVDISYYDYR